MSLNKKDQVAIIRMSRMINVRISFNACGNYG